MKAGDVEAGAEPWDLEAELAALGPNAGAARELVGRLAAARKGGGVAQSVTRRVLERLAAVAAEHGPAALGHGLGVLLDNERFDFRGKGESAANYVGKVAAGYRPPSSAPTRPVNGRHWGGGGRDRGLSADDIAQIAFDAADEAARGTR